jgi:tetratricopeptide (TPR) repeat protein
MARSRFPVWLVLVLLVLVTMALYWPVTRYDFINLDDSAYVTENSHVQHGLTRDNVVWAFTNLEAGFWHPLTWLSYLLDYQTYGLRPGGFHLTNLLLHAASTILLFLALRRMTGAVWRSALVAALFALHPLHVESVAWIAERKGLLSTFFFMLALWAYAGYVEKAEGQTLPAGRQGLKAKGWYGLALLFFILGLMSKTMVVTLPVVLLLLDWWPLHRLQLSSLGRRVWEKLPFFACSLVCGILTVYAEKGAGALSSGAECPFGGRIANAILSYARYLLQTVWPANLAVIYPYPNTIAVWSMAGAAALLLIISAIALRMARHRPCIAVGWLWYLVTLLPVIGLIQVGIHASADRYTYIPLIGVFVSLVWGIGDWLERFKYRTAIAVVLGAAALFLCGLNSARQLRYWKNGVLLFSHAIEVTENNYFVRKGLGIALATKGQIDEAIRQFQEVIRLKPDDTEAHYNLGIALARKGQTEEAIRQFQEAIRLKPDYTKAHYNLGDALARKGQTDEAIRQFQEAIRLKPDDAEAHNNLGTALARKGQTEEAIRQYQEAIGLKPDNAEAHYNLGNILFKKDQTDEAIRQFQEAIRLTPDYAEAHYSLGNALGRKGQIEEAIRQYQEVIRLNPEYADAHYNLGSALLTKGQIEEAIHQFREVIRFKPDDAEAHNNLGTALGKKGQTEEAISQFQEVIRLKPDSAHAHNNLGTALLTKGQIEEAISQFQEAIRLTPDYAEAHYNLGNAFLTKGRIEEAIRQYREVIRLKPEYADAHYNLGSALLTKGQIEEAIRQFQEVIRLKPDDAEAQNNLARALRMKNAPAGR